MFYLVAVHRDYAHNNDTFFNVYGTDLVLPLYPLAAWVVLSLLMCLNKTRNARTLGWAALACGLFGLANMWAVVAIYLIFMFYVAIPTLFVVGWSLYCALQVGLHGNPLATRGSKQS